MPSNTQVPSISRPLRIRAREDLKIQEQWFRGRRFWAIKDPVTLRYFQLRDEEYAIVCMLDGNRSMSDVQLEFDRRFAPERLSLPQLQSFLAMLHQEGLVITETSGQGEFLLDQHQKIRRRKLKALFSNPLAIRFHGIDPERLLRWLDARLGWVLSPIMLAAVCVLVVVAVLNVAMHFDEFTARLPDFQVFFGVGNVVWLVAVLGIVKVVHELGHGVSCRHFAGECHELGVMLLVFTPCLYCNVSDAWMLPNKWRRIVISMAGIAVEIVLASVCSLLWWFSEPGMFNAMCLNLVFVCSVSTLVFNGNPLLRYDGYYVLSDWLEVPNLREDSQSIVSAGVTGWFTGLDESNPRRAPSGRWSGLVIYAVAAFVYRFLVIGGILWFVYRILEPHGLQVIAFGLGLLVVAGLVIPYVLRMWRFFLSSWRRIMWGRFLIRSTMVIGVLAALAMIPIPHQIAAPVIIEPADARRVYVTVAGTLQAGTLAAGSQVQTGDELGRLHNADVDAEIVRLQGARDLLVVRVQHLEGRRITDRKAEDQLVTARKQLAVAEERLEKRTQDRERLILRATVAGTILPPPDQPNSKNRDELPNWSGSPLDPDNEGAFLKTGAMFCLIGDPQSVEARLIVDQSQMEFITNGQTVKLHLKQMPGRVLEGTITDIAQVTIDDVPTQLMTHEDLASRRDAGGRHRPVSSSYQLQVRFTDSAPSPFVLGSTGRAKIVVQPRSIGDRMLRYLQQTFRFRV
ncbi:MAG: HlyD family efflux transporter periplasmic adaptor subunit [Planctomycetota bacterium]|nr:HlyD family efflux transporter periplasmic adaptor subunit [Planctomycetota bacterium]